MQQQISLLTILWRCSLSQSTRVPADCIFPPESGTQSNLQSFQRRLHILFVFAMALCGGIAENARHLDRSL